MALLTDLYNKAKKRLFDIGGSVSAATRYRPDTSAIAQSVKSVMEKPMTMIEPVRSFVENPKPTVTKVLNTKVAIPKPVQPMYNFISKNDPLKLAESGANKLKFDLGSSKLKNPVARTAVGFAEGAVNQPQEAVASFARAGRKLRDNDLSTTEGKLDAAGAVGELGVNLAGMAVGGGTAKTAATAGVRAAGSGAVRAGVRKAAQGAALTGAKVGAGYGASMGVSQGLQGEGSAKERIVRAGKEAVSQGAIGSVAGGILGGATAGGGAVAKSVKEDIATMMKPRPTKRIVLDGENPVIPKRGKVEETIAEHFAPRTKRVYDATQPLPEGVRAVPGEPKTTWGRVHATGEDIPGVVAAEMVPKQTAVRVPAAREFRTPSTLRGIGEALPRPGMSIEDVSPKIREKNAKARELVRREMENRQARSPQAEPGFVAPDAVQAPKRVELPSINDAPTETPAPSKLDDFSKALDSIPTPWEKKPVAGTAPKNIDTPKFDQKAFDERWGTEGYNKYQKAAFEEKGKDIKRLGELITPGKYLQQTGWKKYELQAMSSEEIAARNELARRGFPKNVIQMVDPDKLGVLAESGYAYSKTPEHVLAKFMVGRKKNATEYITKQEMENAADNAVYDFEKGRNGIQAKFGMLPKKVKETFDRWAGLRDASRTKAYETASKFKDLDPETSKLVVRQMEKPDQNAPEQVKYVSRMLRDEYDNLKQVADGYGIDVGYLQDYLTHIWRNPQDEISAAYRQFRSAGGKFKFGSGRTIPTYEEGIALGLTPKYDNPSQILYEYVHNLEKTKANLDLVRSLKMQGFVVDAAVAQGRPGQFKPITAQGFPKSVSIMPDGTKMIGDFYAPDDLANSINSAFDDTRSGVASTALKGAAWLSGKAQDITMSGGIPKTPINAFSVAQLTKEWTAGRFGKPVVALFRSMSGQKSEDYFRAHIGDIKQMQERGIPMNTSLSLDSLGEQGFFEKALFGQNTGNKWDAVRNTWNRAMNEPTFKRFLPQLQVGLFADVKAKALKKGLSDVEAADVASKAIKNFYGVVSSGASARRNKGAGDLVQTVFFAPRYREAMVNFWLKNVAALRHPLALENQMNVRFMVGALATYAAYDYLNKTLNGRHLWENPSGKEDKLLIPAGEKTYGMPILSSIATIPRGIYRQGMMIAKGDLSGAGKDAAQTYTSILVKPFADIFANENYYGQEIVKDTDTPSEKFAKQGRYLFEQYTGHPWVKAGMGRLEGDSLGMTAVKAFELPIREYSTDKLASGDFWDKFTEAETVRLRLVDIAKTDQNAAREFANQNAEALATYDALLPFKNLYSEMKKRGDQEQFGSVIRTVSAASSGQDIPSAGSMSPGSNKYLNKIELDRQKLDFEASGENFRDLRDTYGVVLRRNEDGTVMSESAEKFDYKKNDAYLDILQFTEDYDGWMTLAEEQAKIIQRLMTDPSIDDLDKYTYQKQLNTLGKSFAKFKSYGGFTKPKKLPENLRYPMFDKTMFQLELENRRPSRLSSTSRMTTFRPVRIKKVRKLRRK
ncbi:MAG: hypothetical protein HGA33_03250 [Candidatus Moranbacteria bacterium]|nr:hypothetical protein [Candidatus Moranbacteria bacterium]